MPPVTSCGKFKNCITGVYVIRNIVNGKMYVGSAALSFKKRWTVHLSALNKNKHTNKYLQNCWNKYGKENIIFKVQEKCPPKDCIKREQYWIDYYKSYQRDKGYNLAPTAGSLLGHRMTGHALENVANANRKKAECKNYRKKCSVSRLKLNQDKDFKERQQTIMRKVALDSLEKRMNNPEFVKKITQNLFNAVSDPKIENKRRRALKLECLNGGSVTNKALACLKKYKQMG